MEEPGHLHTLGTFLQGATTTVVFLFQCSMSETFVWNVPDVYHLVSFTVVSISASASLAYNSARVYGGASIRQGAVRVDLPTSKSDYVLSARQNSDSAR